MEARKSTLYALLLAVFPFFFISLSPVRTEVCSITGVRLGGQAGDQFIGPTCNNDGTYRSCFYLSGPDLPTNAAAYTLTIEGVPYAAVFLQVIGPQEVVVCVSGVPGNGTQDVDVTVDAGSGCIYTATDLIDEPQCTCNITDVRVGGEPGDQYIGPTCNNDGTYRTCLYVTGSFLPTNAAAYTITIDGVDYPAAFAQVLSPQLAVVCVTGVPGDASANVDVTIDAGNGCIYTATDLFDEPPCTCNITDVRVGGEPGDQYIGLTCNNDGTYRTCLYVTGSFLPTSAADYTVTIDGVDYPAAFAQVLGPQLAVVCVTGVPGDASANVDVTIDAGNGCTYTATDLFDEPQCTCNITDVRVAGQPGDAYIGPTCNNDGTYRSCLYVTGSFLPTNAAAYTITIDGVDYPAAFAQVLGPQLAVVCVSGVPGDASPNVDVTIDAGNGCTYTSTDLFDEPQCTCNITDVRVAGQPGDAYIGPTCNNDGTYRSCLYLTGSFLPTNAAEYTINIDGVDYPAAFAQVLSPQLAVVCVSGVPADGTRGVPVRVSVVADPDCQISVCPLYDEPLSCPGGNHPPDPISGPWSVKSIGGAGGGADFDACNPEVITIRATGDSKQTRDEQQLVYRDMCGNAEIIARVRSQSGIGWVGLEMRRDLSANSPMVVLKRKRNPIVRGEYRLTTGGKTDFAQDNRPHDNWLRLVRIGNTFTGYTSTNGVQWRKLFTRNVAMPNCLKVGLFAESLNDRQLTVGVFDHISVNGAPVVPLAASDEPVVFLPDLPRETPLDFDLYPNPAYDRVTVGLSAFAGQPVVVELRSLTGALVLRQSFSDGDSPTTTLDVGRLPPGAYLVSVSSPTGRMVKRLVVGGA
ncbi:phosphohistidine swiveling domain-containing protein [Lewinella marina]|nr:T9SS type A sorting domain-containing protein [Neolewinella marina]NJB87201.1 phosphohistidine swiveling domain-containing protein [Neolewinella marina]